MFYPNYKYIQFINCIIQIDNFKFVYTDYNHFNNLYKITYTILKLKK